MMLRPESVFVGCLCATTLWVAVQALTYWRSLTLEERRREIDDFHNDAL
jgi:hypothetical protein